MALTGTFIALDDKNQKEIAPKLCDCEDEEGCTNGSECDIASKFN